LNVLKTKLLTDFDGPVLSYFPLMGVINTFLLYYAFLS